MGIKISKLIGDEFHVPLEHRILNIVLVFGFLIAVWSAITNFLLGLDSLLVLTCIISSAILAVLYYLSAVKGQYTIPISALVASAFIITPVSWILNGGISGSIPYYIILFSAMGATLLFGYKRIAVIAGYIVMSTLLICFEYTYPSVIIGYSSNAERYIDIFID